MKKKEKRLVVVFDVAKRAFQLYPNLTDAAGHVGLERSELDYRVKRDSVYYTGSCFIGLADVAKDNRGGNKGENQGFKQSL